MKLHACEHSRGVTGWAAYRSFSNSRFNLFSNWEAMLGTKHQTWRFHRLNKGNTWKRLIVTTHVVNKSTHESGHNQSLSLQTTFIYERDWLWSISSTTLENGFVVKKLNWRYQTDQTIRRNSETTSSAFSAGELCKHTSRQDIYWK
jgi:hypothetical protein